MAGKPFFRTLPLDSAKALPLWRQPVALLFLMALCMPIAFATWTALLNNFVIEVAGFDGSDIGWLHTVREIPGFLAIGVIALIMVIREQVLGLLSLVLLGAATAVTAQFPSLGGILMVTLLSSIGFHYYETVNQSLQLQWLDKKRAPQVLGWLLAAGSGATLVAYGLIILTWRAYDLSFSVVYWTAGGFTALVALYCLFAFPQFEAPNPQRKQFILRRRYWLYYALQFMAGARRQIFVVFAGFMMVERFGFDVHEVTLLFMVTLVLNMICAPLLGKLVSVFGERMALGAGICRADRDLPALCRDLLFRLGRDAGHRRFTSSITCSFRWPWPSRPISRRSPIPATSRPRPPSPSPSTISRRCSCPPPLATCGWSRRARSSCWPLPWRWCRCFWR